MILVLAAPRCVFYALRYWTYCSFDTDEMVLDLLWFDTTNTDKHTQDTQRPIYLPSHINIHWHHLICAHCSFLYYTDWITLRQKIFLIEVHNVFTAQNYSLVEAIHLLITFNKTKSFLWNTKNTGRNAINGQNTRTTHRKKYDFRKGYLVLVSDTTHFCGEILISFSETTSLVRQTSE